MAAVDSSPAFVGRDAEIGILDRNLARAIRGESSVVVVGGEAGVGKSRLITEFAGRARGRALVLEGRCFPAYGHGLPYAPFADLLRDIERLLPAADLEAVLGPAGRELRPILPDMDPVAIGRPADAGLDARALSRSRMFDILLGVAERLQQRTAAVIVIEDLHWADQATLDLLGFLVRGIRQGRILLLLTVRTDDPRADGRVLSTIGDLERTGRVERIELRRFSRDEVATQLAAILQARPDPELVERVLARSDGNPFFAEELLAAERRGELADVPPLLDDLLRSRLATLADATRGMLRVAAVAGIEVDDGLVAAASGLSPLAVAAALREATDRGLLVRREQASGGYAFRHSLLQQAVERELLPGERRRLHAACADALEHAADPEHHAGEIARHWSLADRPDRALPAAVMAGLEAERRYAFTDARRLFEQALALLERIPADVLPADLDVLDLLGHAADVAALSGDPAVAVALARKALATLGPAGDPDRTANFLDHLRWYLWQAGDRGAAEDALEHALRLLPEEPPTRTRARVLAQLGGIRLQGGRLAEALTLADESIAAARATGAVAELALALGVRAWVRTTSGQPDDGIADLHECLAIAELLGQPEGRALGVANLAMLLLYAGRPEAAWQAAVKGLEDVRPIGLARAYGGTLAATAAAAEFDLGRWADARRLCATALDLAPTGGASAWPAAVAMRLAAATGDGELARLAQVVAEGCLDSLPDRVSLEWYRVATVEVELANERPARARELAATALDALPATVLDEPAGSLFALALRSSADCAEIADAADDARGRSALRSGAAELVAEWRGRRESFGSAVPHAGILEAIDASCDAEARRAMGDMDPAAWERTAVAWERIHRPYAAGYARYREAEAMLLRSHHGSPGGTRAARSAATPVLRVATENARDLGARPLLAATVLLARRAHLDVAPAGAAGSARVGPPDGGLPLDPATEFARRRHLTTREVEVLNLVAAGWTNREIAGALFISGKTASVHVSNILGKLGVGDRVEAAVLAQRAGLVGPGRPGTTASDTDEDR